MLAEIKQAVAFVARCSNISSSSLSIQFLTQRVLLTKMLSGGGSGHRL